MPAHVPEPPPQGHPPFEDIHDPEHRILIALSKLGVALRSLAWQDAGPRGLTPTQAQVLVALRRGSGRGQRLSQLAATLAVSAPTVSDSVGALERKGLVEKSPAPDDARALAITLTAAGADEADGISEWPDLLLSTVAVLDDDERGVFLRGMIKMIRELQERGRIAPSRMCATCRFFRPYVHDDPERPHHCAFVDAPFGDRSLRLECAEHEPATDEESGRTWAAFASGGPG